MMKIALYQILEALFVLKLFKFLLDFFAYARKGIDKKAKVNFKIYDFINWETNNQNKQIAQYLKR